MDPINRQTARERPDLLEWRKCQGKAGWYGILSMILGGSVTFAGTTLFCQVPKKLVPLISLGTAAVCGWFVSVKVMNACQQALRVAESGDLKNIVTDKQDGATSVKETKFGDKNFLKE